MRRPMRKSRTRQSRSKAIGRGVGGGQVVPASAPRQHLLEGHVGGVGHRPVGVAVLVVLREVAPQLVAVGQPVGADDARVADVDHVGVRDVEPDAEADEEDAARRPATTPARAAAAGRGAGCGAGRSTACARAGRAAAGRRSGPTTSMCASLKKATLTPKAMRTAQVEVAHAQRPARVDERRDEEQRQRDPHPRRVDLAPERAGVAAGHRPRDLEPGPRLGHPAGRVVDVDLRDLLGLLAARAVVADLPARAGLLEDVGERPRVRCARADGRGRAVGDLLRPGGPVSR